MKSLPVPGRPSPSAVRRDWSAELATQFWGEDDATTVFANAESTEEVPLPETARKLRPRGRPRDLRPRRPGPRSPGFAGVWLAANALPTEPARSGRLGPRLAAGLVVFGVGLAAGRLFLGAPFAPLQPAATPVATKDASAVRATAPVPAPAAPTGSAASAPPAPELRPPHPAAAKVAAPSKKRRHARSFGARHLEAAEAPSALDETPSPDLLVPRPRSIVRVDPLDLTLPDSP